MADEKSGAGDAGTDAQKPDTTNYVTPDALNKAIDARFKRFERSLDTKLTDFVSARSAGAGAATEEGDGEGKGKAKSKESDIDARLKALEAENRKLKTERDDNKKRERINEERGLLREAFKKHGAKEDTLDDLVTARYAEGIVVRDDAGEIVWRTKEGDKTVEEGAAAWLKSDRGKSYLPPAGGRGSNNRGGPNGVDPAKPGVMDDQGLLDHVL